MDFGPVRIGITAQEFLTLTNAGSRRCYVVTGPVTGDPGFAVGPRTFQVPSGQSMNLRATFAPSAAGAAQGTVQFLDQNNQMVQVRLTGSGQTATASRFAIVPDGTSAPSLPSGRSVSLTGNDDGFAQETLPFAFDFLGTSMSSVFISTNGFISFANGGIGSPINRSIPTSNNPNAMVAWFWDDLILDLSSSAIRVSLVGTSPRRRFVIVFRDLRVFGAGGVMGGNTRLSAQVELHEGTHEIVVHYGDVQATTSSRLRGTMGWENANGSSGGSWASCSPNCAEADWPTRRRYRLVPR